MLDIIIPLYKIDKNKLYELLDSINNQKYVNFDDINITIPDDSLKYQFNNDALNRKYKNLNINYFVNKINLGIGLNRQCGFDKSNNEYVMFMDDDDILYDERSLYIILECIKDAKPDMIVSNFIKEILKNNKIEHQLYQNKETFPFLHGKVFKREFLINNNIRFNPNLRHLEDSYFFTCVMGVINYDNIIYLKIPSYLWRLNEKSVSRNRIEYDYVIEEFKYFYNCPFYAYEYLKEHNSPMADSYLIKAIYGIYLMLYSNEFSSKNLDDKRNQYINLLNDKLKEIKSIYTNYNLNELEEMFNDEKNRLLRSDNKLVFNNDFNNFINKINNI